jgi:hypothetical protein
MCGQSTPVLYVGCRAYWDTIAYGLIPCKVLSITKGPYGGSGARVELTRTRGAYTAGETISTNPDRVIPRNALTRARYGLRIRHYIVRYSAIEQGE